MKGYIARKQSLYQSGHKFNSGTRKMKIHWIDKIGWHIAQQAPSFEFLDALCQTGTAGMLDREGPPPGKWTCPSQPLGSELGMLGSEVLQNQYRSIIWAAAFIHKRTISKFLNLDEKVYAMNMLLSTIFEQAAITNHLGSRENRSKFNNNRTGLHVISTSGLSVFVSASLSLCREELLKSGQGPVSMAKLDHLVQFCGYHMLRLCKEEGPETALLTLAYRKISNEISEMDLSDWTYPGDEVLIGVMS